ncbi:MAG TPA: hypothetical protein VGJ21_07530 [Terracidiphilus sp.]|jgi:hypothetical protein
MEKLKSRRLRGEIRRVLMAHWDPIGVKDLPEAADEYDGYIWGVLGLLLRSASNAEIVNHLRRIEIEQMGLCDLQGVAFAREGAWDEVTAALQMLRCSIDADSEHLPEP